MILAWYDYLIAIGGGLLAGIVNTLAGNGSAVTLTIFMEVLGLPPDIANGTNRVGILAQTSVSTWGFYRSGHLQPEKQWLIVGPMFVGAVIGVETAIWIDPATLKTVIAWLMVLLLLVLLVKPSRWLGETDTSLRKIPIWLTAPVFLILGFYGGFIQMGMGVFFLVLMVLGLGYSLTDANGVKLLGVFLFTIYVLGRFALEGLVHWEFALIVAAGQASGGWIGMRFATRYPKANLWTYRVLILVILVAVLRLFGAF